MKNKNKKTYGAGRIVFFCIIAFIIGAVVMCAAFYVLENKTDVDWAAYIENVLIPNGIAIVVAIGTTCLALKPIIDKIALVVTSVVDKFKQATDDVNATVSSSARSEEEVYQSRREISEMKQSIEDIKTLVSDMPEAMKVMRETRRGVAENNEMSRLGFGSMNELVKNGAARRITSYRGVNDESEVSEDEENEKA